MQTTTKLTFAMNTKLTQANLNAIDFIFGVSDMPNEGIVIYLKQLLKKELKDFGNSVETAIEKTVAIFKSQIRFIDELALTDSSLDALECKREIFAIHYEECIKELLTKPSENKKRELVPVYVENRNFNKK